MVLVAVAQNGHALGWSSKELQADWARLTADREEMLAAVAQNGSVLRCASEELKGNMEVVLVAVAQNVASLQFASAALRNGGLREHVLASTFAHHSFVFFLLAAKPRRMSPPTEAGPAPPHPHVAPEGCVLRLLNAHGPHFAVHLKRRIADFAGVPVGRAWKVLCAAAVNLL